MRNRGRNTISYKMKMKWYNFSPIETIHNISQIITGLIIASVLFTFVFILLPNILF